MVDTFEALDAKLKLFIFKYIKTNIFFKFTIKNFIIFWGGKVEIVDLGLFSGSNPDLKANIQAKLSFKFNDKKWSKIVQNVSSLWTETEILEGVIQPPPTATHRIWKACTIFRGKLEIWTIIIRIINAIHSDI